MAKYKVKPSRLLQPSFQEPEGEPKNKTAEKKKNSEKKKPSKKETVKVVKETKKRVKEKKIKKPKKACLKILSTLMSNFKKIISSVKAFFTKLFFKLKSFKFGKQVDNVKNKKTKASNKLKKNVIKKPLVKKPSITAFGRKGGSRKRFTIPGSGGASPRANEIVQMITGVFEAIFYKFKESKILLIGVSSGIGIALIIILVLDFYSVQKLTSFKPNVTTKIYDKNGVLISELFRQKREIVTLNKIPENLQKAFIAIEDDEFYDHWGINPKGIVRAFFINVFAGRIKQGGSTITQQLSKILLTSRKRSIIRKIKEAFIALMIEMKFSKNEILNLYLNQIFLGHGAYGVESAAKFYFNKHVWELNLAQCSLLATLPSAPNRLSPIRYPRRAINRHKIVLSRMVELGYISKESAEKAFKEFWPDYLAYISELPPSYNTKSMKVNKAPWFTEYIRRKLIKKYGEKMVFDKGLMVYTTLDLNKQLAAQEELKKALTKQTKVSSKLAFTNDDYVYENYADMVKMFSMLFDMPRFRKRGSRINEKVNNFVQKNFLEELEGLNFFMGLDAVDLFLDKYKARYVNDRDFKNVEGCVISINQNNGYIETLVGGSEFSSINQLNRPFQSKRQPGSAIKPLLYAAAFESGKFTPSSTILDSPVIFLDNEGGDWLPENYEGTYHGLVRLREALARSINVVSIKIGEKIGISRLIRYYSKLLKFNAFEKRRRIRRDFSITLGSLEVSPYELTRAYAIIANGGKDVIPFSIRYIKDSEGKILENREADVKKILEQKRKNGTLYVIKPSTAQLMISLLQTVVNSGTGGHAKTQFPTAGKTGTTNNYRDAWFVGFTPYVTSGVWVGYDSHGLSLGSGQSGGSVAAPIWGKFMRKGMRHHKAKGFPVYAGLVKKEVCKRTGLIPSGDCKDTVTEFFIPKYLPKKECDLCSKSFDTTKVADKGPKDNISRKQKKSILNKVNKDGVKILDDMDNLLD